MNSDQNDLLMFGQRLRHFRKHSNLTLAELGKAVDKPAPYLSQLENGHIEPRLTLLSELAGALGCGPTDLLDQSAPNRRAELEVSLLRIQQDDQYRALKLPYLKPGTRVPDEALEHILALYQELVGQPETLADKNNAGEGPSSRSAIVNMRSEMRDRGNYFAEIEKEVGLALLAVNYSGDGPISERTLVEICEHFGFTIARVPNLPRSARSVTDKRSRVIYIPQLNEMPTRAARSVLLQTIGHFALGHRETADFASYLRQRVESNYFAGAILAPEQATIEFLQEAYDNQDIAVEDLREKFYISYEMAAHRLTNLATKHLGLEVHFIRSDEEGVVWKAYENDGVPFPLEPDGTIEGKVLCKHWSARQAFRTAASYSLHYQYTTTASREFWAVTHLEIDGLARYAVTVGASADQAKWFRGSDTNIREVSYCPSPTCCRQPTEQQLRRWEGVALPSARDRSQVISGLPPEAQPFTSYPGVDMVEVYEFLDTKGGLG